MRNDSDSRVRLQRVGYLLSDLEHALNRLREALARTKDEFIRDASIQRFEFTF